MVLLSLPSRVSPLYNLYIICHYYPLSSLLACLILPLPPCNVLHTPPFTLRGSIHTFTFLIGSLDIVVVDIAVSPTPLTLSCHAILVASPLSGFVRCMHTPLLASDVALCLSHVLVVYMYLYHTPPLISAMSCCTGQRAHVAPALVVGDSE